MNDQTQSRTTAERVTMGVSILILASILVLVGWTSMRSGDAPPEIDVVAEIDNVRSAGSLYYVPIVISNHGGRTAQTVTVSGELVHANGEVETADITIDFLAGGESERAELIFSSHPNEGEFTVFPVSFLMP